MKKQSKILDLLAKAGWGVAVFAFSFFLAFVSSSQFMPVSESSAEDDRAYYANVGTSGEVAVNLESTPGGVAKVSKDTLTVNTNAQNEYRLYISTAEGAGDGLYLSSNPEKYVSGSTGKIGEPTRLATNTWGFAKSRATSEDEATVYTDEDADPETGKDVFIGVPEFGDERLLYVNSTPTVAATNTLDVYYGMSASSALPSGTYSNTIVYTAIVDSATPESSNLTITPNSQVGPAAGQEVTITTGFYPGDFGLTGLGDIDVYIGNSPCTDVTPSLAANGSLVLTCKAPKGRGSLALKVFLRKFDKKYILSDAYSYTAPGYIEKFDCSSLNIGESSSVNDRRDEDDSYNATYSYYSVAKLKDGRCWLTENLDVKKDFKRSTLNSVSYSKERMSDIVTGNPVTVPTDTTADWCSENTAACHDQPLAYKAGSARGTQYNWYAATMGSGHYSRTSGDAGESMCPAGWRLPTRTEFQALINAYGSATALASSPANFALSGQRIGTENTELNEAGYYWSATTAGVGSAYALSLTGSSATVGAYDTSRGFSVRCINLADTVQNFTPPSGALIGDTKAVYDTRDNEIYHVGKLADGKWWMLDDLELGDNNKDYTLTPSDTNITKDFVLPNSNAGEAWCSSADTECSNQAKVFIFGSVGASNLQRPAGYYYNFYAATAGKGEIGANSNYSVINEDICPKGWRLPISNGNGGNEADALLNAYGGYTSGRNDSNASVLSALTAHPAPRFAMTGSFSWDGKIWGTGDGTITYWTSSYGWGNVAYAFYLNMNNKDINASNLVYTYNGYAVRCLRKDS